MSPDKLAYMANQIGKFFAHQKHEEAVESVANHILRYWDPRMRREIVAHQEAVKLDPVVREAITKITGATKAT